MSSVPSSRSIIAESSSRETAAELVQEGFGGMIWSVVYLFVAPVRAAANGFALMIASLLSNLADMLGVIPGGSAQILRSGAQASANAVEGGGMFGFILAFVVVFVVAWLWALMVDLTDSDIPILGQVPLIGPDSED